MLASRWVGVSVLARALSRCGGNVAEPQDPPDFGMGWRHGWRVRRGRSRHARLARRLLQNVEVDATGTRLRFEFKTSDGYGPIAYDLERI